MDGLRAPRPRRRVLHSRLALDHHQRGVQRHAGAGGASRAPHRLALRPRGHRRLLARLPEHAGRRLPPPERRHDGRGHPELPHRRALPARDDRPDPRRQLRPRPTPRVLEPRTATRHSRTAACSSPRSAAGSTARRARPPGLVGAVSGLLPLRRPAPAERPHPRVVVHLSREDRGAHPLGDGDLVVRRHLGAEPARQALARGAASERADRRQRRLRRPGDPHRPRHPPHRLAVRAYRRRLVGPRVPLEARRHRLPAREGRRRGRAAAGGHLRRTADPADRLAPRADLADRGRRARRQPGDASRRARRRLLFRPDPRRPAAEPPPRRHPADPDPRRRRRAPRQDRCTCSAAARRPRATPSSGITPAGRARRAGTLGEPLSDLGAAVAGSTAYLAGGYTGAQYATGNPQVSRRCPHARGAAPRRPPLRGSRRARRDDLRRRRNHDRRHEQRRIPVRPLDRRRRADSRRCRARWRTRRSWRSTDRCT